MKLLVHKALKRKMRFSSAVLSQALFVIFMAAAIAVLLLLRGFVPPQGSAWIVWLQYLSCLICAGLLIGTVMVLDDDTRKTRMKRIHWLRFVLAFLWGVLFALTLRWPVEWTLLSGLIAGILGWLGKYWIRIIDGI